MHVRLLTDMTIRNGTMSKIQTSAKPLDKIAERKEEMFETTSQSVEVPMELGQIK